MRRLRDLDSGRVTVGRIAAATILSAFIIVGFYQLSIVI